MPWDAVSLTSAASSFSIVGRQPASWEAPVVLSGMGLIH